MDTSTIWEQRWASLQLVMERLIKKTEKADQLTLQVLASGLHHFGEPHFVFFKKGFDPLESEPQLELRDDFPKDYILRHVIDRIAFDLTVIRQAVEQRSPDSVLDAEFLAQADALAALAVKPAISAKILPQATEALTYVQKSLVVRVVPYATVALFGVPLSAITTKRDLLAIPHEAGHYVFWNGTVEDQSVEQAVRTRFTSDLGLDDQWMEEIFADVYGCLVGGPVMAIDFQHLLLEHSREQFTANDGDHPIPIIRPYIYSQVLRLMDGPNGPYAVAADALDDNWENRLQERGYSVDSLTNDIDVLISRVKIIYDMLSPVEDGIHSTWTRNVSAPLATWEQDFEECFSPSGEKPEPEWEHVFEMCFDLGEEQSEADQPQSAKSPAEGKGSKAEERSYEPWKKDLLKQKIKDGEKIEANNWFNLFLARGWTTEGPHTRM